MTTTVSDQLVAQLEALGIGCAFGVLSIHNMPLLDAMGRSGRIRFVPARGEAGAVNMADAAARVSGGLGLAITSTGTGAGNAAGALVEAQTAGTPLLHLTGQVALPYLDRGRSYVHEAPGQTVMLGAVSKAVLRVWSAETAPGVLAEAAKLALTPPCGPVSVEIPIDLQGAPLALEGMTAAALRGLTTRVSSPPMPTSGIDDLALDQLASALGRARRPILWLGGGARHARQPVQRLMALGVAVVTSLNGRGIVAEGTHGSLGSFNSQPAVERFFGTCDAMLVVGSRLRVPETLTHQLKLPRPLWQVDLEPRALNRAYVSDHFLLSDSHLALTRLADRLEAEGVHFDETLQTDANRARSEAEAVLRGNVSPYDAVSDAVQAVVAGGDFNWVRDVTIGNATWGNRLLRLPDVHRGVHATGGGIGQGLAMAIGAAVATPHRRTWALVGDGGLALNLGELATAVQERTRIMLLVMNDGGYGILRNLQDADYGGRRHYADLHTPRFDALAAAMGMGHCRITSLEGLAGRLTEAAADPAPAMLIEFDMHAIGPYARAFTGPPLGRG
jgi:acetolactate synthase-1/2/3 large subunit